MADVADVANDALQHNTETAVAALRARWARSKGAEECEECGADIPEPRRKALPWATTCVECQSLLEQKQQHYR